ncbi:hypothetical protein [Streptomyces sp. BPTC-684]|uniref:hypothetical protein n=1 Tax=Streptomyces sp. BPTC-684 TaxID=3043734 RepID=UPI0024B2640A|nr:hypothetical protein [Streptomyces sp. BPTC-684]WHM38169.1 hypothetical protein QIY60_15420 [Streptomyces sp. BPTC-684]
MTQSRQGDEPQLPAVRPAHEGVVLPADGSAPLPPGPPGAQPWGQPWGPPQQDAWAQPLPPESGDATQYIAPVPADGTGAEETQYLSAPAAGASDATQYIAPVPGASDATQYIAPVPGTSDATQFLAPVPPAPPGALPPEANGGAEATQYLPPVPDAPYGIRPGAPEERQPPAEFDSLFRTDGPPQGQRPGENQQLPRFAPAPPVQVQVQPQQPPQPQQYAAAPYDSYDDEPPRRSRLGLIAAVGVGLAVVGLGAGYLISGTGGDGGEKKDDNAPIAATTPTTGGGDAKAEADPAKAQAVELDKLLADSNNSRDAVIGAVADIRGCDKLDAAATTLRDAARQRGELVTRLQKVAVDKLPNNAKLTAELTKAWQASASADNHYAAWADQSGKDKGCKRGHARRTADANQGDRDSGAATLAKKQAAGLWNAIAGKYGLTKRSSTQL